MWEPSRTNIRLEVLFGVFCGDGSRSFIGYKGKWYKTVNNDALLGVTVED